MESLGYLIAAVGWGVLVGALLLCVAVGVAVTRWRRRAIVALEEAEEGRKSHPRGVADR
ncbi:hypothetical protein [Streptomyces wuyuanensis]|uniref:hypothetical protein n=1 Tax=Streptomyces wuyuanensis TaxID=1196353 RepID=UPI0037119A78